MKPSDAIEHNRAAWNRLANQRDRLTRPAREEDFRDPLAAVDGPGWLEGDLKGKRLLCLAAGGGRQGPLYAAAGAVVTVVDISPVMLERDRLIADQRGLSLTVVEASMDRLTPLADQSFDVVIHPVSTCYVPDVRPVFCEVARVLVPGGLYISQHKQPTSLQVELQPERGRYRVRHEYYREEPLPACSVPNLIRENGTLEWIHRWEDLLGGMGQAGLSIEDVREPCHARMGAEPGSFEHRSRFVAPYVRIKARRREGAPPPNGPSLIVPD